MQIRSWKRSTGIAQSRSQTYDIPSDGLVALLLMISLMADSLGTTAKFPRDSIAFKWADETAETTASGDRMESKSVQD